jgi:hypothetical protein
VFDRTWVWHLNWCPHLGFENVNFFHVFKSLFFFKHTPNKKKITILLKNAILLAWEIR